MKLFFDKGTIKVEGDYALPHMTWDERSNVCRSPAFFYRDILQYLETSNIPYEDNVLEMVPAPPFSTDIKLREYQKKAMTRWLKIKWGTIVLPTGSGKTILAMKIIEKINSSTIILVPTLDLLHQWKKELKSVFSIDIGEFSGQLKDIKSITVSTYSSAYLNAEFLGNKFKLLICDEIHHLASENYIQIAEIFASPLRLGLTATFERQDGQESLLNRVFGGKIFESIPKELSSTYLSEYDVKRIKVSLTEREKQQYEDLMKTYRDYLISHNIRFRSQKDYKKLIMRSGRDSGARKALLAKNKAQKLAFNSENKLEKLAELLDKNDRIIIFTRYNDIVYKISKRFFIPCITHHTKKEERKNILNKFKTGLYTAIASSQVLDEGINVPEANVGIILSGTGSLKEYTQRLGRLLRPRPGKRAILYEIVTDDTLEMRISYRRSR